MTLDLAKPQGQAIAKQLLDRVDVVVENFRPGKMESWGLGPAEFQHSNPSLVYTRISGYGQTGPYASRLGFASACEGVGGLRYVNGYPGETPVRPNLSIGDTLAGMHAVIGTLLALLARQDKSGPPGSGQTVDVSIVESVFNMLEGALPEFDGAGVVREPSGSTLTGIVPTNTYRCSDGKFVVIGGNGDSIFKRLMKVAGRADLADDDRLSTNTGRVVHEREIDAALASWTQTLTAMELLTALDKAEVPAGPINSIADIARDPHFKARGMFEAVVVGDQQRHVPAIPPRLLRTPGSTDWPGPDLGEHTDAVLQQWLDFSSAQITELRAQQVI